MRQFKVHPGRTDATDSPCRQETENRRFNKGGVTICDGTGDGMEMEWHQDGTRADHCTGDAKVTQKEKRGHCPTQQKPMQPEVVTLKRRERSDVAVPRSRQPRAGELRPERSGAQQLLFPPNPTRRARAPVAPRLPACLLLLGAPGTVPHRPRWQAPVGRTGPVGGSDRARSCQAVDFFGASARCFTASASVRSSGPCLRACARARGQRRAGGSLQVWCRQCGACRQTH